MTQPSSVQGSTQQCNTMSENNVEELNPQEIARFFNGIAERVVFIDIEKKILWANKAAAESVSLPAEKLRGRRCYQVMSKRSKICNDCPLTKIEQIGELEERVIHSTDGKTWLIKSNPVRDDNGCIIALVETVSEISS
jgi:transcriptional regulator with PAS, ATPase and Fis domain